jgi:O-antigen/teichoic acid export membrane protein
MKKTLPYLIPLLIAFLILATGLLMCMIPSWNLMPMGVAFFGIGTLTILATAIIKMITSRRRFVFNLKFMLKLIFTAMSFILFTVGLGLIVITKLIVLGIILAAIGLLSILFIVPMFIAFVRANPFEHIIITPNYDDVDTEFFRDPKNKE